VPVELQIAFNVIGTTTVILGFVYATVQFRAFLKSRRQETALTLMRTTAPPDLFSRSVRRVFELPDDAPMETVHGLGPELEQAVLQTCVNYENLGYLVYARMIPLHLADELNGGMIRLTWRKFRDYLGQFRAGNPAAFEWFEWLYDRLEEYPLPKTEPAHIKYRDWRP
jgi:hypothetical protein